MFNRQCIQYSQDPGSTEASVFVPEWRISLALELSPCLHRPILECAGNSASMAQPGQPPVLGPRSWLLLLDLVYHAPSPVPTATGPILLSQNAMCRGWNAVLLTACIGQSLQCERSFKACKRVRWDTRSCPPVCPCGSRTPRVLRPSRSERASVWAPTAVSGRCSPRPSTGTTPAPRAGIRNSRA